MALRYLDFVLANSNHFSYTPYERRLRAAIGFWAEFQEFTNTFPFSTEYYDELGDCYFWWTMLIYDLKIDLIEPELKIFEPHKILDAVEKLTRIEHAQLNDDKLADQWSILTQELNRFRVTYVGAKETVEKITQINIAKLESRSLQPRSFPEV